jgi:hypothetical protein
LAGNKTHASESDEFVLCDWLELVVNSDSGGVGGNDVELDVTGVQHQPKSK